MDRGHNASTSAGHKWRLLLKVSRDFRYSSQFSEKAPSSRFSLLKVLSHFSIYYNTIIDSCLNMKREIGMVVHEDFH